jgi:two-component system response regulator PhoP
MHDFREAQGSFREQKRSRTLRRHRRYPSLNGTKGSKVMRILVVEDETELRESLKRQLADKGFGVEVAGDGEEGLFAGLNYALDAAIVDVGLPKRSGLDVIREWRAKQRTFPVVVLTARNSWQDRVEGLSAGADDYVGKPFSFEEVVARVRGVLRRVNGWCTPELECGPFVLNTRMRTLTVHREAVELTSYEYRVLEHLMLRAGQTLSGTELLEHLYEEGLERESNVIAQLICRLRRKLDPLDQTRPIETVYAGGYRFAVTRGPSGQTVNIRRRKAKS